MEFPGGLVVKDLTLSLLWLWLLLWLIFYFWFGNFSMPWEQPKKIKELPQLILCGAEISFPNESCLNCLFVSKANDCCCNLGH